MKVIQPITITDAMLVSSTVAEPSGSDPAIWNAATAYSVGDLAYRATTHMVYRRLVAGTTATVPESDLTGTAPKWELVGATNRWAMFDTSSTSAAVGTSPMTAVLDPGVPVGSMAFIGLVGDSLEVTITDGPGGSTLYTTTVSLSLSVVLDWYAYFFEPYRQRGTVVLFSLPPYTTARITATLTGGGTLEMGGLIIGNVHALGTSLHGATAGIRDYSRATTDADNGITTLEERRYAKRMNVRLHLDAATTNAVHTLLTELRATPCMWIGDDTGELEPLSIFGWAKNFYLTVAYRRHHAYNLQIEGMT